MHEWKQECRRIEVRGGHCPFYDTKTGCCDSKYPGTCRPITDECRTAQIIKVQEKDPKDKDKTIEVEKQVPCYRIVGGEYCSTYINPAAVWRSSPCPFAGKMKAEVEGKKIINPLKASKRAAAGKKG
jgi:hypothetical protein